MDDLLERFIQKAPVAVLTQACLRRVLADDAVNKIFENHARRQYTKELAFSTLIQLMAKVTFGTYPSVHAAYRFTEDLPVSITAVYDKLRCLETGTSQALVAETAQSFADLLAALPTPPCHDPIAGLRVRILDGNALAGTEHRLACLRGSGAAALPGMSLVIRDARTRLLTHFIPCEDAYSAERSLHPQVLPLVAANDLWIMDRNFCTLDYLEGMAQKQAFFLVRHHQGSKLEALTQERHVAAHRGDDYYEQTVRVSGVLVCRCLLIRLAKPLRDGSREIRLLTNVSGSKAGVRRLAELYRTRWKIEHAFQELTENLHCEINTLGYPKAALFAFALALVAYNLLVTVQGAMGSGQDHARVEKELSSYYLATEVAVFSEGIFLALPEESWLPYLQMPTAAFAQWLHDLAAGLNWQRYRKSPRGPKIPIKIKRTSRGAHRSTARALATHKKTP